VGLLLYTLVKRLGGRSGCGMVLRDSKSCERDVFGLGEGCGL
jgi:hypothetical protein